MNSKALNAIRNSSSNSISAVQAADILGFAYIKLLQKLRSGEEVGFAYFENEHHRYTIPREEFIYSVDTWKWSADNIKLLSANFLSVEQAANAIGCAEKTLRKEFNNGTKLGFEYFQIRGIWRINKKSFLEFMEG